MSALTPRIDTHSHYYGETLFAALAARSTPPFVQVVDGVRFMVTSTSRFPLTGGFASLHSRLAWMDGHGIGRQVITFPGALGPDVLPGAAALVRDVNDELASVCTAHPTRFLALAGLPLADLDEAMAELARIRALGLPGVILPGNYFLSLATMAPLRPLLRLAGDLKAHVMVHPGHRAGEDLAPHHYDDLAMHRASTVDLHNAISHAAVTLLHAGLAEHFPGATFQLVNLGGALPMLLERMDHVAATRDAAAAPPSSLLGGLLFDTASLGPRSIEIAVAVLGAERVMFGTDYPIFDSEVSSAAMASARIGDADRAAIAAGTAQRLFGTAIASLAA